MPVDVRYTVTLVGPDGAVATQTFTGRSNAYGYWDGDGAAFTFPHHGEYRVDIEARGTDAGDLWVGRMRFGSACA